MKKCTISRIEPISDDVLYVSTKVYCAVVRTDKQVYVELAVDCSLNREVCSDVRNLGEYRRMSRDLWKSVRRLGVSITELRVLGDFGDGNEALRVVEAEMAQLHELERQMELRALEKELFIQKLVGNVPY
ncbi:hypothetical protein Tco_0367509 [Tanacetum coccineum]